MRYPRPLSLCSETRLRPSFLRTTPAKKPRTECCCQSVARMIAPIVAPSGRRSIASTRACLVPGRLFGGELILVFALPGPRFVTSGLLRRNGNLPAGRSGFGCGRFDLAGGGMSDACLLGSGHRLILDINRFEASLGDATRPRSA